MVRIFITIHGLRYSWDTHRASNVVAITISSSFLERMVMRGLGHIVDPIWNGPKVVVVGVSILLAWRYYSHACWAIARQVWESLFTWKIIKRSCLNYQSQHTHLISIKLICSLAFLKKRLTFTSYSVGNKQKHGFASKVILFISMQSCNALYFTSINSQINYRKIWMYCQLAVILNYLLNNMGIEFIFRVRRLIYFTNILVNSVAQ